MSEREEGAAQLVRLFIKRGFTRHVAGPMDDPRVIILFYSWVSYIDVAHIRSFNRADVARIPATGNGDVYNPAEVVWHFFGNAATALMQLRDLGSASSPDAPTTPYKPPPELPDSMIRKLRRDEPGEALRVNIVERDRLTIKLPNQ